MSRDLFSEQAPPSSPRGQPLADRMRPRTLDEVIGQEHLLGPGRFLSEAVRADRLPSLILWGPPGVGKTTLAHAITAESRAHFVSISAVLSGVKDVKKVIEEARYHRRTADRPTILFVDEIHRFNKAQQDAFLPHVEDGTLILVGATTENPSFEVISPLLSRTRVLTLHPLSEDEVVRILRRALEEAERGLGRSEVGTDQSVLDRIARFANGDARTALNALEAAAELAVGNNAVKPVISEAVLQEALQHRTLLYDKSGEEHYNLISALHKSLRNSDADAALYWLARMLEAGEDPLYIARRLVRFASEDVGLADPQALRVALDAMGAFHFIGLPEGKLALAQATVYLAVAPKSNALYAAYSRVSDDVARTRNEPPPLWIRNAPTRLMKELGYGEGYEYAHEDEDGVTAMECLPEGLRGTTYYRPTDRGVERRVAERIREIRTLRESKRSKG
jgi:putative ATPase